MDEIVEVLGIISLIVMIVAFFSGLFMKYKRNSLYKIHRFIGYVVFALALAHGVAALVS